jgi:hypothetical protein
MKNIHTPEDLDKKSQIRLILDFWHRTMMHHSMWFAEVQHQLGRDKAYKILEKAWGNSYRIQLKRLSNVLGFNILDEEIPAPMADLPDEMIHDLREGMAVNWLANDGVWFQAVEFSEGMNDAKRCNDSCWAHFSPFEAWSIKQFLNMDEQPGLQGLKKSLNFRLYASINTQRIVEETADSFVFQMNNCRVQSARKRKGLADYPCKSAGLVEYPTFASAIDARIKTECIGCPPDNHPEEWYCAWKFSITGK